MSLYRKIKTGSDFDYLIPKSNCTPQPLRKGDTSVTMQLIKKWVYKHKDQTKRLAEKLQGITLDQTIANIHTFLYNHFQYQADSSLQHLYSPACAWTKRQHGIDCKSYTIIASTVLMNLKIPHKIRRIKQPYFNPTQYTHVYVVVPVGKEEKVIDGTIPINKEVPYLKKDDLIMYQHQGLNAPAIVQDNSFEQLLHELKVYAKVSDDSIARLNEVYDSVVANGFRPVVKITENGMSIGNINVPLETGLNGFFSGLIKNIFPKHTILGKILGSTNSGPGISFRKKRKKHTSPTYDYQAQLEAQRRQFEQQRQAEIAKQKEEAAAKKKKVWMWVGIGTGVVVLGTVTAVALSRSKKKK